MTTIFEYHI